MTDYDCIVIGAGSVGVPISFSLAKSGLKTLVIDELQSVSQGDNKHAIGGIRATHSQISKSIICQNSIDIFSKWESDYDFDIWWVKGGYSFLAYEERDEKILKETVQLQKSYGLNIDYISPEKLNELIPGINKNNLLGGSYSPDDGVASPLLAMHSFYDHSIIIGTEFKFGERVLDIITDKGKAIGVKTDKKSYYCRYIINAAGSGAKEIGRMIGVDLPIICESHEAGITEPVTPFFSTMVVDIRPKQDIMFGNSKSCYFYQNKFGKIIFCITPDPPIIGTDRRGTSSFLPQVSKRMITLLPRLKNIRIRRTWRGLYPMTPDGNPIIGKIRSFDGFINAVGMCGQGFMLGPGIGELVSRLVNEKLNQSDYKVLKDFSLYRNYDKIEKLK